MTTKNKTKKKKWNSVQNLFDLKLFGFFVDHHIYPFLYLHLCCLIFLIKKMSSSRNQQQRKKQKVFRNRNRNCIKTTLDSLLHLISIDSTFLFVSILVNSVQMIRFFFSLEILKKHLIKKKQAKTLFSFFLYTHARTNENGFYLFIHKTWKNV